MKSVASVQVLQEARLGPNVSSARPLCLKFAPIRRNQCWPLQKYNAWFRMRFSFCDRKFWLGYQNLLKPREVDFSNQLYQTSLLVGLRFLLHSSWRYRRDNYKLWYSEKAFIKAYRPASGISEISQFTGSTAMSLTCLFFGLSRSLLFCQFFTWNKK